MCAHCNSGPAGSPGASVSVCIVSTLSHFSESSSPPPQQIPENLEDNVELFTSWGNERLECDWSHLSSRPVPAAFASGQVPGYSMRRSSFGLAVRSAIITSRFGAEVPLTSQVYPVAFLG